MSSGHGGSAKTVRPDPPCCFSGEDREEILDCDQRDITTIKGSAFSLKADGLLQALPPEPVANFIACLMFKAQVPLPAGS